MAANTDQPAVRDATPHLRRVIGTWDLTWLCVVAITNMNLVVEKMVHRREIGGMAFNALEADLPVLPPITRRVMFGFKDVGVLAEQMPPLPETHPHVENGLRL